MPLCPAFLARTLHLRILVLLSSEVLFAFPINFQLDKLNQSSLCFLLYSLRYSPLVIWQSLFLPRPCLCPNLIIFEKIERGWFKKKVLIVSKVRYCNTAHLQLNKTCIVSPWRKMNFSQLKSGTVQFVYRHNNLTLSIFSSTCPFSFVFSSRNIFFHGYILHNVWHPYLRNCLRSCNLKG